MQTWVVTGGIGTGKSALCALLAEAGQGIVMFSADAAVHEAYDRAEVRQRIAAELALPAPTSDDVKAFRAAVRERVRHDAEARQKLEAILHPLVWKARDEVTARAKAAGAKVLVAEIPLYYETGAALAADRVIVVAASQTTQLQRLQVKRALDAQTSQDMLAMQWPLSHKIDRADVVIWNDGTPDALRGQASLLLQQVQHPSVSMVEVSEPEVVALEATPPPVAPVPEAVSPAPAEASPASDGPRAQAPFPEEQSINELQTLSPAALYALAEQIGWRINASRTKHQLIFDLIAWMGSHHTKLKVEGIFDADPAGFGVIRYPKYSLAPLPEDVFVPAFVARKFNLRAGQHLVGFVKAPVSKDKFAAVDRLTHIEGVEADKFEQPAHFDKLTALFPSKRIILETPREPTISSRVVDIVAPMGMGQRAIIMASPRSGKTILLKDMAKSITVNHPDVALIVLLLDERPEEVTDFEESVVGGEIYASTFDETPKRHTALAELVLERAKRLVEAKRDVVILLDSITRLARGYNALAGGKGRTMSGGMDAKAIIKPKKFFGSARNVEEGGSLTIVGTALVETESRMDDLIFEEFKGTGNMEICLDREMAERRIFPAIHVTKSGTRRDDLLYHPDEMRRVSMVRRQLAAVPAIEALETLIRNLNRTKSNAELLLSGLK